jgi:hypothetical protein
MGFSWGTTVGGPIPGPPPPPVLDRRTLAALAFATVFGALLVAFAAARPGVSLPPCTCGHDARAHEHYRRGTECAFCKPWRTEEPCLAYEPARRAGQERGVDEALAAEFIQALASGLLADKHVSRPVAATL